MLVLTASHQLTRSVVVASKSAGFRLPVFRSRLQMSLYRNAGLPIGLVSASSPYMIVTKFVGRKEADRVGS